MHLMHLLITLLRFESNFISFPNVHIEHKAIWGCDTILTFNYSPCSRYHSANDIGGEKRTCDVQAIRLDNWLIEKELQRVDILKMNIEGAELEAIKGLGNESHRINVIVGEFHPDCISKEEFVDELQKKNFEIIRFEKAGRNVFTFEARASKPS